MIRKALILVAGMGTRLKPLTETTHKCLTEVNGTAILMNALNIMEKAGMQEVVLVVGYLGNQIRKKVGSFFKCMQIRYVENSVYASTSTSFSLLKGIEILGEYEQLFVLEGDVFFEVDLFKKFANSPEKEATLIEKYHNGLDGSFVELDQDAYVIDWTHKNMRYDGYCLETKYKTVNIHKFSRKFVESRLIPNLTESTKQFSGKEPLENVFQRIVKSREVKLKGIMVEKEKWVEIDDLNDLKIAENMFF